MIEDGSKSEIFLKKYGLRKKLTQLYARKLQKGQIINARAGRPPVLKKNGLGQAS